MKKIVRHITFFTVLYLVLFPQRAHAYLDPGTGSYVLQVAAAVFFGGLFLVKTWWSQISGFLSKLLGRKGRGSEKSTDKK